MIKIFQAQTPSTLTSKGRNGIINTSGVEFMLCGDDTIMLTPVTSRGVPSPACFINIDKEAMTALAKFWLEQQEPGPDPADDIIYSLCVEDVQEVARERIGRELNEEELDRVLRYLGKNGLDWYETFRTFIELSVPDAPLYSDDDDEEGEDE